MKSFLSFQFHHLFTPVRSCVHKLARISSPSTPSRILCAAEVSVFTLFINSTSSQNVFIMPPTRKGAGGIMFSGCPSIRTGISLPRNLKNPWVDFYHTWPRGAPWGVDELIRFWARSAQGQWTLSKYAIFTSFPRNLKNPWVDFYQTWHRGAPWGVDELSRF